MKLSILIIATLLVLSQAVNLRKNSNQNELGQLFKSLSQQDKTDLFATFPMLAQMTGPLNDVQDFINQLELDVMAEQRQADLLYATESARCDGEIAKRADNLAVGQKALAYEQNRRAMCQTAWTNAENTMVNLVDYAEGLVDQRAAANALRGLQHDSFMKLDDDFNNFIGTIDGAQYYIQVMGFIPVVVDEIYPAFLETHANADAHLGLKESAFAIVKSAITHGMLSHTSNVIGKVSMFLRMNQNVFGAVEGEERGIDSAMLETLWQMFEDLRTTAQAEQNLNYQQEVTDVETHVALIEVIDANEAHNNAEIATCQELIDTSSACVAQATTFVEDLDGVEGLSEGRLARQERIMIKANTMCDAFDSEYESTTEVRKNQINLLKALRTELFIRLDNVYGSARTRAEQEQEEWESLSL